MTGKYASKLTASALALAAFGFAAPAMALVTYAPITQTGTQDHVNVNISVLPIVSVWVDDAVVNLQLNGTGPNNATAASTPINILNNVPADLKVRVAGTLDPAIWFFIFGNRADPAVVAGDINLINGVAGHSPLGTNAYAPASALVWSPTDVAGSGTERSLASFSTDNLSALPYPIVYAADNPGPLADTTSTPWSLTVTYTIAAHS